MKSKSSLKADTAVGVWNVRLSHILNHGNEVGWPVPFPENSQKVMKIVYWFLYGWLNHRAGLVRKKHNCASAGDWSLDNRRSLEIMKNLAVLFIMLAVFKKYFC